MSKVDGTRDLNFATGSYAPSAEDALIEVTIVGGVGSVNGPELHSSPQMFYAVFVYSHIPGHLKEFAVVTFIADRALIWMIRDSHLHNGPPDSLDLICFRLDYHSLGCWGSTGKRETAHSLDLNDTHSTSPKWFEILIKTQGWHIQPCPVNGLQYRGALLNLDFFPVNVQVQGIHNHISFLIL
jgi:hypothetical protein